MQQPPNETHSEYTRTTVAGRQLRYTLEIVQQPEKARACGAGPRSSADRRPVDPPPVIELRVFDRGQEITMQYDAGFMLYASLEAARPIAQGRMHNGPIIPVLTGVAVASAAYLDRPRPAGYFIFPDLSVRHEGWYRLKFSLFEAIKHPQDADPDRPFADSDNLKQPVAHEAMANRMEVQSTPFQVFSAKKFPGLNTSTSLSRVVAEQGCRVRIRRDIRQRKRSKGDQLGDLPEEGQSSYRGTPDPTYSGLEHSRSHSRSSIDPGYAMDHLRRPSIDSTYGQSQSLAGLSITGLSASMSAPPPPAPTSGYSMSSRASTEVGPPSGYTQMYRPAENKPSLPMSSAHPNLPGYSRPISPDSDSNVTLPPLTNLNHGSFNPSTRLYNLSEASSSKRSYSPHSYNQETPMKSGARPDQTPQPSSTGWSLGNNGIIEPDDRADDEVSDSDDSLMNGELVYHRADGSRGNKISTMMPYFRR